MAAELDAAVPLPPGHPVGDTQGLFSSGKAAMANGAANRISVLETLF